MSTSSRPSREWVIDSESEKPAGARGSGPRIPRNVLAVSCVSFLNDTASEMVYPVLPMFLTKVLGASIGFVGVIEGIAESTASLLKLASGWLSDRIGKRKGFVVAGYALAALSRPFIGATAHASQVLGIRFLDRFGKGIRTAPRDVLIAESASAGNRGASFGFHRMMDNLGAVAGPLCAFLLLQYAKIDLRLLFFITAIPGIIAVIVVLWFVRETKKVNAVGDPPSVSRTGPKAKKKLPGTFYVFLIAIALFTLGNSSDAFLLLRAQGVGVAVPLLPIVWVLHSGVKSVVSLPGGIISDRFGRKPAIVSGWIIYAAVYAGFAFVSTQLGVWLLFASYGVFYGLTEGVEKALVTDLVHEDIRGTAFGVYHAVIGLLAFPSSALFGLLWQHYGHETAFLTGTGLAIISAVVFVAGVRSPLARKKVAA